MAKSLAVIVIHGMGDTRADYDRKLKKTLRNRLGEPEWRKVVWRRVFYQPVLQANQVRLFGESQRMGKIDWLKLRRFVLYGFSDAASMQMRPYEMDSAYQQVQERIVAALADARDVLGDPQKPVVLVSHSLGCQVISNFIWDAQQERVDAGVFRSDLANPIGKDTAEDRFLRLQSLRFLITTGCNIPIFVAGIPRERIRPVLVDANGWSFRWENYYDPDDVLGWPLHPLSARYKKAVAVDKAINVGSPITNWTPLSHGRYWGDRDFLRPLERAVRSLL